MQEEGAGAERRVLFDRDDEMHRLRELVKDLQEKVRALQARLESLSSDPQITQDTTAQGALDF